MGARLDFGAGTMVRSLDRLSLGAGLLLLVRRGPVVLEVGWARTMARRATVSSISGGIVVIDVVSILGILVLVVMMVRTVPVAIDISVFVVSSIYGH